MSKPANAAPAAPIQPDGLVIETDADGFQTCSVKNTAKSKKMKFTSIEYIKLVKMFVYNFELITKTKKVNLEKLKNCIYSIPTSSVAYEFTRKIYKIFAPTPNYYIFNFQQNIISLK